jgi:putative ABC transport system substrate-binding protein
MSYSKYLTAGIVLTLLLSAGGYWIWQRRFTPPAPAKVYHVGIVIRGSSYLPGLEGFKKKMAGLGYQEGANIQYTVHIVDRREDLPGAISDLITRGIDLLHVYSTPATIEAYKQTKTVPIVFGSMGDPLASKTVKSLESSGTNVTGVNSFSAPLTAKRLEFLLEAAPAVTRVAIAFSREDTPGMSSYNFAQEAAAKLGVTLVPYYITQERPVKETARAITKKNVDGMIISADSGVWANLSTFVEQSLKESMPFAVFDKDMVANGGLIGYGPDYFVTGEQSAVLADKILRGQPPATLPIETPRRLILAINLKTARALGIEIPRQLLQKADLIINE